MATMARTEQLDGVAVTLFDESPEELREIRQSAGHSGLADWLDPVLGFSLKRLGPGPAQPRAANPPVSGPSPKAASELWYVNRLGGWPGLTGRGVKVAVLDTGCGFRHCYLPQLVAGSNYASSAAQWPDCAAPSHHGTWCAGVIGARGLPLQERIGVAPGSDLGFGQLRPEPTAGRLDLFLMLSWAISHWGAQVVSHSRAIAVDQVAPWAKAVMSHIACRARRYANALIFSAAGVAVGAYDDRARLLPQSGAAGLAARQDALLGPGWMLETTEIGTDCDRTRFSRTSAACAFVAGCAALYYEWHAIQKQPLTAHDVLARMIADAELIRDDSGRTWRGVRFPQ